MSSSADTHACQGCGRCSRAAGGDGWLPLDRAVDETSEAELAAVVREIVREAVSAVGGTGGPARVSAPPATPLLSAEGFEIPVGISVRHAHICRRDLETLFGPGAQLTKKTDLFEPGEFAANEVLTLVGPKLRAIENVRILGPMRDFTQVELSRTDGIYLGLDLPMKKSGDLKGAAPLTLVGPAGSLTLPEVAIRSNRHIHLNDEDAASFGVRDNDIVRVRVPGEEGVIYENVQVRVNPSWLLTMHVDTDDANASNLFCNMKAYLLPGR